MLQSAILSNLSAATAIPVKVQRRIKVADRFNWQCYWCGQGLQHEFGYLNSATIEHLLPRSQGGKNGMYNLAAACYRCNNVRGDTSQEEFAMTAREFAPDTRNVKQVRQERLALRRAAYEAHKANNVCRLAKQGEADVTYTPTATQRFVGKIANIVNWLHTKVAPNSVFWVQAR